MNMSWAYLWLATFNCKQFARLIDKALQASGGPDANFDGYAVTFLMNVYCGEFRDLLYSVPMLPAFQEAFQFDQGDCMMVRCGAFPMFSNKAPWEIYDLSKGKEPVYAGVITTDELRAMHSYPSQSLGHSNGLAAPLL